MTPSGNIRLSQQGGLRVTIEEIEHLITAPDVAYLLGIEPDPVQTATIDLNDPPRYARGTTDGREAAR